jgi:hypothetical protein
VDETGVRLVRGPLHWSWVVRDLKKGSDIGLSETGTGSDVVTSLEGSEDRSGRRSSTAEDLDTPSNLGIPHRRVREEAVEKTFGSFKHLGNGRALPLEREGSLWIRAFANVCNLRV